MSLKTVPFHTAYMHYHTSDQLLRWAISGKLWAGASDTADWWTHLYNYWYYSVILVEIEEGAVLNTRSCDVWWLDDLCENCVLYTQLILWTTLRNVWQPVITMVSNWAWWRLKSAVSPLFTQTFIQVQINENIKAPRHWPLCTEFTGDRWIPRTKDQ